MKNESITSRDVDFAKWYTDVVRAAKLADYTSVKGCIAIEPNGYAIWEKIQSIMDKKFKELGHVNVQMPLLIPEHLFNQEKELIEGFAPELLWATAAGDKTLEERHAIRSTSETVFCDYYKKHIKSYKDLPKLYNQWCNVFRYEKETRPFLRSREFLWQEGHTVHATASEAEWETKRMMDVYKWFNHEILAIPSITGKKTEKEKFAGAEYTITNEDLMYNGVCLQDGTSHYFGQKFSKAYDVKFTNKDNKEEYAYYTTWGKTTRAIAAIIMVHADDYGLVLPLLLRDGEVFHCPVYGFAETCTHLRSGEVVTFYKVFHGDILLSHLIGRSSRVAERFHESVIGFTERLADSVLLFLGSAEAPAGVVDKLAERLHLGSVGLARIVRGLGGEVRSEAIKDIYQCTQVHCLWGIGVEGDLQHRSDFVGMVFGQSDDKPSGLMDELDVAVAQQFHTCHPTTIVARCYAE